MKNAIIFTVFFTFSVLNLISQQTNTASPSVIEQTSSPVTESEVLFAETTTNPANVRTSAQTNGFVLLIQAIFSLVIVLGMVYGFVYFLKQISSKTVASSKTIKVLSSQSVTSSTSLHVVEIEKQVFLLGSGDNITLITEFTNQEAIDNLRLQAEKEGERASPSNFIALFKERLNLENLELLKPSNKKSLENQIERLKRLKGNSLAQNNNDEKESTDEQK